MFGCVFLAVCLLVAEAAGFTAGNTTTTDAKGRAGPSGVFLKASWASEVPRSQLDSWFALVAKGRAEGPSSPYYVSELGIQQIASGGQGHAYPPGIPAGTLMTKELAILSNYFHLFDRVYIGTATTNYSRNCRDTDCHRYADLETQILRDFMKLYPLEDHPNLAWYLTEEGCIEIPSRVSELLHTSVAALHAVAPLPILWSPGFCVKFDRLPHFNPNLETMLESLLCSSNMTSPISLHFQDLCGQTATFEFPFFYNYSGSLNVTDGLGYYQMLKRVQNKCPDKLLEVKVNMEMFIEHLNAGKPGENNGAFILDADPREVGDRQRTYSAGGADIGLSWALPHWWSLHTYANRSMGIQCTPEEIKTGTCRHPYLVQPTVPIGMLSRAKGLFRAAQTEFEE